MNTACIRQGKVDITCEPLEDNTIDWDCIFVRHMMTDMHAPFPGNNLANALFGVTLSRTRTTLIDAGDIISVLHIPPSVSGIARLIPVGSFGTMVARLLPGTSKTERPVHHSKDNF